jgi:hypothetical protein
MGKKTGKSAAQVVQPSLYDEVKKTTKEVTAVASLVWVLISIVLFGINMKIIKEAATGELNLEQAGDLWLVFGATAPLAISVLATAVILRRTDWHPLGLFLSGLVLAFAIWAADQLGSPSAMGIHVGSFLVKDFRPQALIPALLAQLFLGYGWQLFVCSFILGGFFSWLWLWKLFPE